MKKPVRLALMLCADVWLMASLAFAVVTGLAPLLGLMAAVFWVLIALNMCASFMLLWGSVVLDRSKDERLRSKILRDLERLKHKSMHLRAWQWLIFVVSFSLMAYGGWIFTAACGALSGLLRRLCIQIALHKAEQISAPASHSENGMVASPAASSA